MKNYDLEKIPSIKRFSSHFLQLTAVPQVLLPEFKSANFIGSDGVRQFTEQYKYIDGGKC